MKFVKRISLFFIYPITMFGLGFVSNMAIQEYFYPGQQENRELADRETQIQPAPVRTMEPVWEAGNLEGFNNIEFVVYDQYFHNCFPRIISV